MAYGLCPPVVLCVKSKQSAKNAQRLGESTQRGRERKEDHKGQGEPGGCSSDSSQALSAGAGVEQFQTGSGRASHQSRARARAVRTRAQLSVARVEIGMGVVESADEV